MTSVETCVASCGSRSSASQRWSCSNSRAVSSAVRGGGSGAGGAAGGGGSVPACARPGALGRGGPGAAVGRAGVAAPPAARRGIMSERILPAKARRSASNWSGSSLDRPGLKTKCEISICRARACIAPLSVSAMSSTGGRRFIFHRRLTTSKPPWKELPPEVGMPRSVTSTNGIEALARRPAFLTAESGSSASTTL